MFFILATLSGSCAAQTSLPFEVKNPKHKKWPEEQALKIYTSACELAARAIRPEQPPHLHPKFVLVLGSTDNETVRSRDMSEIRLKDWMPEAFAQAIVVMAIREVLPREQVADLVHSAVISSQASVSLGELQQGR
jgi:hypothetical protein